MVRSKKRESTPSVRYAAWEFKGSAGKMLTKVQTEMRTLVRAPFGPIDAERAKGIRWVQAEITDAAQELMRRIDAGDYGQDATEADLDGDDE